jgi:prepilin-type processing-associated H-X9-DG protein
MEVLVVTGIVAIIAAILFPVFLHVREKVRQTHCLSNSRQMGTALNMYVQDHDGVMPMAQYGLPPRYSPYGHPQRSRFSVVYEAATWADALIPYVKNAPVFHCASDTGEMSLRHQQQRRLPLSYGINLYSYSSYGYPGVSWSARERVQGPFEAEIQRPAERILLGEALTGGAAYMVGLWSFRSPGLQRHTDGANYLMFDGRAKWARFRPWPGYPGRGLFTGQNGIQVAALYPEWCPWLP